MNKHCLSWRKLISRKSPLCTGRSSFACHCLVSQLHYIVPKRSGGSQVNQQPNRPNPRSKHLKKAANRPEPLTPLRRARGSEATKNLKNRTDFAKVHLRKALGAKSIPWCASIGAPRKNIDGCYGDMRVFQKCCKILSSTWTQLRQDLPTASPWFSENPLRRLFVACLENDGARLISQHHLGDAKPPGFCQPRRTSDLSHPKTCRTFRPKWNEFTNFW